MYVHWSVDRLSLLPAARASHFHPPHHFIHGQYNAVSSGHMLAHSQPESLPIRLDIPSCLYIFASSTFHGGLTEMACELCIYCLEYEFNFPICDVES